MSDLMKKSKRVETIIKTTKAKLATEQITLTEIRSQKLDAVAKLKENQNKYLKGVDQLNEMRKNGDLRSLLALERGLDSTKNRLFEDINRVNNREEEEKNQIQVVVNIQSRLKSFEKLQEQYILMKRKDDDLREQKRQDEIASANSRKGRA